MKFLVFYWDYLILLTDFIFKNTSLNKKEKNRKKPLIFYRIIKNIQII